MNKLLGVVVVLCLLSVGVNAADTEKISNQNEYKEKPKVTIRGPVQVSSFSDFFKFVAINQIEGAIVYYIDLDSTIIRPNYPLAQYDGPQQSQFLNSIYMHDARLSTIGLPIMEEFARYLSDIQSGGDQSDVRKKIHVDALALDFFKAERDKGAIFIALTARKFEDALITDKSLLDLGYDFSALSGLGNHEKRFSETIGLSNGICYVGGVGRKAEGIVHVTNHLLSEFGIEAPIDGRVLDDSREEIVALKDHAYSQESLIAPLHLTLVYKPFDYADALIKECFEPWYRRHVVVK